MSSPIDLERWREALADGQAAEEARHRFEQHRFNLDEAARLAAAESVRFQAEEVEARLQPLKHAAEARRAQLEDRLAALSEQQEALQTRAARGQGSAARINDANRTLQKQVSDCAAQLNVIAKLLNANRPEDLQALAADEVALLTLPMDATQWTGAAETALPRTIAGAGVIAFVGAMLPWFESPSMTGSTGLLTGIAGDATATPVQVLGYAGILFPILLIGVGLTDLRHRSWLVIASAFATFFICTGIFYARITATEPWWTLSEVVDGMRPGAWLYGIAALTGLIAACYYAQGEGNTVQRSLRTAGWLVALFVVPGFLAAGVLALRPPPPPISVAVSTIPEAYDALLLTITNNTNEAVDVSLPWSNETPYGIRVEIQLPGAEMFRSIEDTSECWRMQMDPERLVNRIPVAPSVSEPVRFDIACIRALGYDPERLRFSLTNADGNTLKAYQAIIPQ